MTATAVRRRSILVAALALLVAAGLAQLISTTATPPPAIEVARAEQTAIARSTSCEELRRWYSEHHSAWKAGIRAGRDRQVDVNLDAMRAILRRLAALTAEGRCGG